MICQCGGHIALTRSRIHQKIDIPDIKPNIINYHLARGRCRICKRRKSASLPKGVTEDLLGPRIKSTNSRADRILWELQTQSISNY